MSKMDFVSSTWTFFEAGHGKNAPDGIESSTKQAGDRLI